MPTPIDLTQTQSVPNGTAGYEKSDVAIKWVFGFLLFLFMSGIAIHFLLGWHISGLQKKAPPADRWTEGLASRRGLPPLPRVFPRLQLSAPADLQAFRAREEAELNSYGWVNKTAGVVRIPIQRAIDLLLEKGLPVRATTNENTIGNSSLQLQQERSFNRDTGAGGTP